ncbi:MAG TPA: N-6 DNA methylase [Roseiflexaceae bacterium]|nr:N-6 DNA methylase [Roseiflexaceae bacterium]
MAAPRVQRSSGFDQDAKSRGAFYTADEVADFLVRWAIRAPSDTVLDPSFGGGVFLRAACQRVIALGGRPAEHVFGAEIHPEAHRDITRTLASEFGLGHHNLTLGDFFEIDAATSCTFDAVVGNPPFVRYQRFGGASRKFALRRAAEQGVRLSELTSSWAPFLVHSIAMIRPGGRLAMVVPFEIFHAAYALPVIEHLRRSFARVTFLTFREKLFADLSEDTILVLGEGRGEQPAEFLWQDVGSAQALRGMRSSQMLDLQSPTRVNAEAVSSGRERLIEYFVPKRARALYAELCASGHVRRLGMLADVGIGYVTGANDFFHLDEVAIQRWNIPRDVLRPAVRRARAFAGLRFTHDDWTAALDTGDAAYLLHITDERVESEQVRCYLAHGEQIGVAATYKCRTRSPWFRVPHVYMPDILLSYMSGLKPRLVINDAAAVTPNNLHVVRMHPLAPVGREALAVGWQTSLTRLSVELEGHALGGGMLKLEPTEAERVVVPLFQASTVRVGAAAHELDLLLRNGSDEQARERADHMVLREVVGLSKQDCQLLSTAADMLRDRRYHR